MFNNAASVVGNASNQLQQTTRRVGNQLQITTDRVLPPQQREEMVKNLQTFANSNPKLAVRRCPFFADSTC